MLRDVNTIITDGGLGVETVKGEGVHFKIGDDNAVAKFESGCGVHEGDKIKVRVITEKIHLFECDTEDENTIV